MVVRSIFFLLFSALLGLQAQQVEYPYPIKYLNIAVEGKAAKLAYMDALPAKPNGKSVILFHGKNFNGYYWKDVIPFLTELGYRVVVPDQLGFGESDKPDIHYSFHQMAQNSRQLLDTLGITKVIVIGHSMGGMLATRFALLYSNNVRQLILENPIGLEDYRPFVPYAPLDTLFKQELAATYESYKKYQQSYYPVWKPEYEDLVRAQAKALTQPNFTKTAWANALTYQMIYQQPVCYEFKNIKVPTLLIIGTADRTIVGKARVPKNEIELHGQYQLLGKLVHHEIENSKLVELSAVGHIPHIQDFDAYKRAVNDFLTK